MTTNFTTNFNLGKPETGDSNWGPVLNNNTDVIAAQMTALDGRIDALETAPGGASVIKVDQELVTFDLNGEYVLANAPGGIVAGTVPMLTFDGLIQDGVSSTKRFEVVNEGGVPKKLKLKNYQENKLLYTSGRVELVKAGGLTVIKRMTGYSDTAAQTSNAQTVSASSEASGGEAWKAVDIEEGVYDQSTVWSSASVSPTPAAPQWWQITFAQPVTFDQVEIGTYVEGVAAPKSFEIRGSNDNMATYDVLYTTTEFQFNRNQMVGEKFKYFPNANPLQAYTTIRIHITGVNTTSTTQAVVLSKVQLHSGGSFGLGVDDYNWQGAKRFAWAQESDMSPLAGDFTLEAWAFLRYGGEGSLLDLTDGTTHFMVWFTPSSNAGPHVRENSTWIFYGGPWQTKVVYNGWNHFALVRNGSSLKMFLNGAFISEGNSNSASAFTSSYTYLGIGDTPYRGDYDAFPGVIRNVRFTKAARYTTPFIPFPVSSDVETLPDALSDKVLLAASLNAYSNPLSQSSGGLPILNTSDDMGLTVSSGVRGDSGATSLVLAIPMNGPHGGTSFSDASHLVRGSGTALTVTRAGVTTSTTQSRFYGSAADFGNLAASSAYKLTVNDSSLALGTGDFTMEGWIYPYQLRGIIASTRPDSGNYTNGLSLAITSNGEFQVYSGASDLLTGANLATIFAWQHIAITRSGSTLRIFKNGILAATNTNFTKDLTRSLLGIGQYPSANTSAFAGLIQDFRVYKGLAKYTSNFTAPTLGALYYKRNGALLPDGSAKCLVSYQANA